MPTEPIEKSWIAPTSGGLRGSLAIVALLMGFTFMNHFNRVSMATAADERIMKQFEITPTRMGMVYSAFLLMYTIGMFPGGLLIDAIGSRKTLMLVGFGSGLFVVLTGAVGWIFTSAESVFLSLILIRGVMGVFSSPLHPSCAKAIGHWIPPDNRARTNGMVNGMALMGVAVTPLVFSLMIAWFGWPISFMIAGLITAGVGLAWSILATDRPGSTQSEAVTEHDEAGPNPIPWHAILRHRSLILLTISYGAVGYFQYLFFYWMNFYFEKQLHLPPEQSHIYAAFPPLGMAVGMPLGGWVSDILERKYGRRKSFRIVPMAGLFAGAVLLGAGVQATSPTWIAFWFSLAMGAVGMSEGPFWAMAVLLGGRRGGTSGAFLNTGGNLLGTLAPTVTPWVGERFGWGYALALGALISLGGVALWLGVDPDERPQTSR